VIPYGIYDLKHNYGYITLGTSHDTSEFACDCLRQWWDHWGDHVYPHADSLLLLCDGGGSNSSRTYLFKAELEQVAADIGMEIRVAHYPPYTSKYNPIEHRLFPHVTRACQGVVFRSVELVQELMSKATTKTGLEVDVTILDRAYETGRKVAANFKEQMRVIFDDKLPQWNYWIEIVSNGLFFEPSGLTIKQFCRL
jgi:Rhodopirellula transposase DDE domain